MRSSEKLVLSNISATATFEFDDARAGAGYIEGGLYALAVVAATWNSDALQLQQLGPDGQTQIPFGAALTANGGVELYLPPGAYSLTVATATGVSASLTRVPTE